MNRLRSIVIVLGVLALGGLWWRGASTAVSAGHRMEPAVATSASAPAAASSTGASKSGGTDAAVMSPSASFADARVAAIAQIEVFNGWLAQWRQAGESAQSSLRASGRDLAIARRAALKALIALDPEAALARAVPRSLRATLPTGVVEQLETPIDAFGDYCVASVCFGAAEETRRTAVVAGKRYAVYTYGQRLATLSEPKLALHGIALDDQMALADQPYRRLEAPEAVAAGLPTIALAVGDTTEVFASEAALASWREQVASAEITPGPGVPQRGASVAAAAVTDEWALGEKSVLWLRAEFTDDPGTPATDQVITDCMAAVNTYYAEASRGRTSFKTAVFPGTIVTTTTKVAAKESGAIFHISDELLQKARDYDTAHGGTGAYNPDNYDRWIVIVKNVDGIDGGRNWGGLASVGGKGLWLNGCTEVGVVTHELGHNQGLPHSHAWKPSGDSPIKSGTHVEYGDVFDIMGNAQLVPCGQFNVKQKLSLHYLEEAESAVTSASGLYRIYRHDSRNAAGLQALKVAAGADHDYWFEYRQETQPQYQSEPERLKNGVTVRWGTPPRFATEGSGTYLLDATPTSSGGMNDAPVRIGETFTDPDYGLNVTPVAVGGDEPRQWIDVQVSFGATGSNHNPTVVAAAPTGILTARTDITFTATGSDPDGDPVYFRWDFGDGTPNPLAATVTHRWLKGGDYTVSATALDGKGGLATTTFNVSLADLLLTWTQRASGLTTEWFYDATYGGGQFVAVGGYTVALSPDGVSWALSPTGGINQSLNGVAYGGGRYVAVGQCYDGNTSAWVGGAAYSTDGVVWQPGALPPGTGMLNKVAYGAGRFVAVGAGGKVCTSTDGVSWSESVSGITEDLYAIRYADGMFVTVGANGRILTSADGVTWANRTPALATNYFTGLVRHQGRWYASSGYQTWVSIDGVAWTKVPGWNSISMQGIASALGVIIAPSYDGNVYFTEDATAWSSALQPADASTHFYAAAEGNGTVVVVGVNGLIYQAGTPALLAPSLRDAATLGQLTSGQTAMLSVEGSGYARLELLVDGIPVDGIAAERGTLRWTPSGFGRHWLSVRGTTAEGVGMASTPVQVTTALPWTQRASGLTTAGFYDATYGGGRFVAVGEYTVALSPDGVSWMLASTQGINQSLNGVTYGAGRYVAVGQCYDVNTSAWVGGAAYSTDGVVWQSGVLPPGIGMLNKVAYGAGRFVAVGAGGQICSSTDGVNWSELASGITDDLNAIRYADGTFVAVGAKGRILTSADGSMWVDRTPALADNYFSGVVRHQGRWYVSSGYQTCVSTDACTWSVTWGAGRTDIHSMASALGAIIAPGYSGRIYFTEDAVTWSLALQQADGNTHFYAAAEGNGPVIVVGSNGLIYQASTPALTISAVGAQTLNADTTTGPLAFTVGDTQTSVDALTVSATSSNPALVPAASLVLGGSGANRTVTVTPLAHQAGSATITLTVSNGAVSVSTSFTVTVRCDPPEVMTQPRAQTVVPGTAVAFSATVTSALSLAYRWQVSTDGGTTWTDVTDGAAYSGAVTSALRVLSPTASMNGHQYRCTIVDGVNPMVTTNPATLAVQWSQFPALSARAQAGAGEQTLILGFVFTGGGKPALVRGVGPGLIKSDTSLAGKAMVDPQVKLFELQGGRWGLLSSNDNWGGTAALRTRFAQLGMGALDDTSKDAAILQTLTQVVYSAQVSDVGGATGVASAEAYDADFSDKTRRLTALSVRNQVGTGADILIAGFVIDGDAPKRVIVRGVGPGLAKDVAAYLRDPKLELWCYAPTAQKWTLEGSNDDWDGTAATAAIFKAAGMGELIAGSKDAALILTLNPGVYTAQVSGVGGTTGVSLVEIYEAP